MEIVKYSREEYLDSVMQISDYDTLKFSKEALDWWDDYYSWMKEPPLCLQENGKDICYLFSNVSKDHQYLTIHNIFTPKEYRQKGYSYEALKHLFNTYSNSDVRRFKMYCVSSSLNFYMKLGLKFWGVNEVGQYYCDFDMPKNIDKIYDVTKDESSKDIRDNDLNKIYEKLKNNGSNFDEHQTDIHNKCLKLMGKKYLFNKLLIEKENR